MPRNVLFEPVEYKSEATLAGSWKRFGYPDGRRFEEFQSHTRLLGAPLLHYTRGICPETGRSKPARGWIAIGRVAVGMIAIGQFAVGLMAIGQLSVGLIIGLGQLTFGLTAIGQFAVGLAFGAGQFSTGLFAIGQFSLSAFGAGQFVWPNGPIR
ncbi:MAG: hypothetical protein KDA87_06890 [Planctomycetales bacterium]|nr:hypothetical protein [Planctomycetales bacterium]